jgi:UDP-N-acetylmuramoyl-L-alanyl-D-glutamate--2,6-diaminopimelate ligase
MLQELLAGLREPPSAAEGDLAVDVTSLATDSREVVPGALFFALPGTRTDGRRFVAQALERGAVAVAASELVDAPAGVARLALPSIQRALGEIAACFYDYPSRKLFLVGVTGTNGKTTVTHLLEAIWKRAGFRPGLIGTVQYRFGEQTWTAPFTTPPAVELQRLVAEMVKAGATHVAMEVSSHALSLERVFGCEWDAVVFTNMTRDHLDFHADMESYFAAKQKLFVELLPRSAKNDRFAVINRDDPYGRRLIEATRDRVVTFGHGDDADVAPGEVERSLSGLRGEIRIRSERIGVSSTLIGEAHLENILAAAAVAWAQGLAAEAIAEGIAQCRGIPGRMERVDDGAPFAVLVDYAHTPDALERAVRVLRGVAEGRLIVVFGCGGDRDRGKRPLMGEATARIADIVIATSDNPRTEDPLKILHEIERGIVEAGLDPIQEAAVQREDASGYLVVPDRRRAIHLAIEIARPRDVVLIAGKGHETYQIVGAERHPFDDREEARQCLRRRGS